MSGIRPARTHISCIYYCIHVHIYSSVGVYLVEPLPRTQGVVGSNPAQSIIARFRKSLAALGVYICLAFSFIYMYIYNVHVHVHCRYTRERV